MKTSKAAANATNANHDLDELLLPSSHELCVIVCVGGGGYVCLPIKAGDRVWFSVQSLPQVDWRADGITWGTNDIPDDGGTFEDHGIEEDAKLEVKLQDSEPSDPSDPSDPSKPFHKVLQESEIPYAPRILREAIFFLLLPMLCAQMPDATTTTTIKLFPLEDKDSVTTKQVQRLFAQLFPLSCSMFQDFADPWDFEESLRMIRESKVLLHERIWSPFVAIWGIWRGAHCVGAVALRHMTKGIPGHGFRNASRRYGLSFFVHPDHEDVAAPSCVEVMRWWSAFCSCVALHAPEEACYPPNKFKFEAERVDRVSQRVALRVADMVPEIDVKLLVRPASYRWPDGCCHLRFATHSLEIPEIPEIPLEPAPARSQLPGGFTVRPHGTGHKSAKRVMQMLTDGLRSGCGAYTNNLNEMIDEFGTFFTDHIGDPKWTAYQCIWHRLPLEYSHSKITAWEVTKDLQGMAGTEKRQVGMVKCELQPGEISLVRQHVVEGGVECSRLSFNSYGLVYDPHLVDAALGTRVLTEEREFVGDRPVYLLEYMLYHRDLSVYDVLDSIVEGMVSSEGSDIIICVNVLHEEDVVHRVTGDLTRTLQDLLRLRSKHTQVHILPDSPMEGYDETTFYEHMEGGDDLLEYNKTFGPRPLGETMGTCLHSYLCHGEADLVDDEDDDVDFECDEELFACCRSLWQNRDIAPHVVDFVAGRRLWKSARGRRSCAPRSNRGDAITRCGRGRGRRA